MVKIALDAGHGINTAGKRSPADEREWSFNNKVLNYCYDRLKEYEGTSVLRLDDHTGRTDIPLRARTDAANKWGADVLISIHHNANNGKWGPWGGVETYTQPGSQKASVDIAKILQPRIVNAMGLRDRKHQLKNLHMTRESHMPAVLTEGGFMDSTTDIIAMRSNVRLKAQGEAIADGLASYFHLKLKKDTPKPTVTPKPAVTPKPTVKPKPTVPKEEARMYRPTTKTFKDEMNAMLKEAYSQGILSKDEWYHKSVDGKLTLDDAVGLQATIIRRTLLKGGEI